MARVTVEDCVTRVTNRFDLVMLAAQRARNISSGAAPTLDRDNDKNPVIALREIAGATVDLPELEGSLVRGLQKHVELDEPEADDMDVLALQQALQSETAEPSESEELAADMLRASGPDTDEPPVGDNFDALAEGSASETPEDL